MGKFLDHIEMATQGSQVCQLFGMQAQGTQVTKLTGIIQISLILLLPPWFYFQYFFKEGITFCHWGNMTMWGRGERHEGTKKGPGTATWNMNSQQSGSFLDL